MRCLSALWEWGKGRETADEWVGVDHRKPWAEKLSGGRELESTTRGPEKHSDSLDQKGSCNAEDLGSIPGSEKRGGYPLQYSCLENSMDRGS